MTSAFLFWYAEIISFSAFIGKLEDKMKIKNISIYVLLSISTVSFISSLQKNMAGGSVQFLNIKPLTCLELIYYCFVLISTISASTAFFLTLSIPFLQLAFALYPPEAIIICPFFALSVNLNSPFWSL